MALPDSPPACILYAGRLFLRFACRKESLTLNKDQESGFNAVGRGNLCLQAIQRALDPAQHLLGRL